MKHPIPGRAGAAAVLLLAAATATAQGYPAKPIRLIVPFPPGGSTEILGRAIGQKFTEAWGQQVIIDHRPGASGIIGTELGARAAPDGYTLLVCSGGPLTINPGLFQKLPYDAQKDFTMVSGIGTVPNVVALHPSVPARSVKELVALARAKPGALAFASNGSGTPGHLAGELFKSMTGTSLTHVPYKGSAPATMALLSGEVSLTFTTTPPTLPHVGSGRLRIIAVTTRTRIPLLPDVPTVSESGLPGYEAVSWYGLAAPAGTSQDIVTRISTEAMRVLRLRDMEERIRGTGAEPMVKTPAEMTQWVRDETAKWGKVIRASGAKPD